MQQIEFAKLSAAVGFICGAICEWRAIIPFLNKGIIAPLNISQDVKIQFMKSLKCIQSVSESLSLVATSASSARAYEDCLKRFSTHQLFESNELQQLISHGDRLIHSFVDETQSCSVFAIETSSANFLKSETRHFGDIVDTAFPSAIFDIDEANKCRALGLSTACVMHLMRALEPALNALAKHVGVEAEHNWNTALNQIDAKLKNISKSNSSEEAEQWASETSAHFRVIKNAWRNHAAHGKANYDEEQSIAIYNNVRFLMNSLAARLKE